MINVNDFKTGQTINYDGNLYQVLDRVSCYCCGNKNQVKVLRLLKLNLKI